MGSRRAADGDGTPSLPKVAFAPPRWWLSMRSRGSATLPRGGGRGGDRGGYGVGEKAAFLIRRISRESIFVKPKHLPPISFSEAPMR